MALVIETRQADGSIVRLPQQSGVNRIPVDIDSTYRIFDDSVPLSPDSLVVRRSDDDLVVEHRTAAGAPGEIIELADYYALCSSSNTCAVDLEGGGAPIRIDASTQPIGALADGSFILYDPSFAPTTASDFSESLSWRPAVYTLGGLAVVGLAAGGGGGVNGPTAVSGTGGERPPDATLKVTSLPFVNTRTPSITGEGEPGARIVVQLDSNGDGQADSQAELLACTVDQG